MTNEIRNRIRKSLADSNLQSALDANAIRRIQVRKTAFESLPDLQVLRERAHSVRAEVIENLDRYLEQFTTHAKENGMLIHHALDADQAIKLVLEIAFQHNAKLLAKSKTMVSEEIGLNHALENNGLDVIETDLGEYIVQLRGEPPSHIITPAVHLRRQDVGRLFQEKLGMDYTEDISIMTNAARQILRQVFLNADIGISGVNFGVAETGTLCLVTNEGNGRMVTTVPHVHIALMGIERIVPTLDDLCLMLSLLPRSATGQKLSVYTSLLNSPRRNEDPDGSVERHVILVDNGRTAVQASNLHEILYCIRCGSCLNACPVFREIGGHAYVSVDGKGSPYPGPVGSVVSPALFGQKAYGHLARISSLCGACREACPVDIDLPKLLLRVRAGIRENVADSKIKPNAPAALAFGLWLYTLAGSSTWRFTIAQWLAGMFGTLVKFLSLGDPWIPLSKVSGWGYSKDFPIPASRSFRSRFRKYTQNIQAINDLPVASSVSHKVDSQTDGIIPILAHRGIEDFAKEVEALGGNFTRCTLDEVADKILEILRERSMDQLLAWEPPYVPSSLLGELSDAGIHIIHPTGETLESSSKIRAGLTGASAGIADTGSLLILGGLGRPMTASLLPEIHIALLWEKDIFENLEQVLRQVDIRQVPAAILVTGPSRTADIEMTLTIGVHGPGELHILCITN
ncbi:MAG: iron-sulfur cluster-binding protein [Chloroflexi bacterium RBG_13_50_21]|nr:MAG: iron-sulfur cluster-binding protein [Chloroflexi bacterium RBG_13_50_21]